MDQPKCRVVLGMLLDKIVNDIFDSSSSDSSVEEDFHEKNTPRHAKDVNPAISKQENRSSTMSFKELREMETKCAILRDVIPSGNEKEFKEYFKVSQETFEFILDFIKYDLRRQFHGNETVPPALQLLLTLRKMSSLDSYSQICEKLNLRKTSANRAVHRVIQALSSRASKFILWPKGDRLQEVCQGFQMLSRFPKTIGALDSLSISVPKRPQDNREDSDTPHVHSVQLQVVVDHEGRFTYCSVGSIGSIEKQEVFNNSMLSVFVSKPEERFPDDCHLVSDPDYTLYESVMVPYIGANLTVEEENFNQHHQLAHNCVTNTIFALKSRFPSLRSKLDMCRLDLVPIYLTACCVLHNISVDKNDLSVNPREVLTPKFNSASPWKVSVASSRALQKRDILCKQLYVSDTEGVCFV